MSILNEVSQYVNGTACASLGAIASIYLYLDKKGALSKLFGKASGTTSIEDTYLEAYRQFHAEDFNLKTPVADGLSLDEIQSGNLKHSKETNFSPENMKNHGIKQFVMMTPQSIRAVVIDDEEKVHYLNYTAESEEKFVRMARIRQYINNPLKMIEEANKPIDASKISKKMKRQAKESLHGIISEPGGSSKLISYVFGTVSTNTRLNGIHNAFLYGARVLLQKDSDTRVTGNGFVGIRAGDTIVVTHKTAQETHYIERDCGTSQRAQLWSPREYLDQLAKINVDKSGDVYNVLFKRSLAEEYDRFL